MRSRLVWLVLLGGIVVSGPSGSKPLASVPRAIDSGSGAMLLNWTRLSSFARFSLASSAAFANYDEYPRQHLQVLARSPQLLEANVCLL
jgi:hypothetical protein